MLIIAPAEILQSRKLLKKLRADEQTSLVHLPACRVTKAKPFRDIWLVGKGEMKMLWEGGNK